jgi:hypothetical protein
MSSYDETLKTLRAARAERDQAKQDVHATRVRQMNLLRQEQRTAQQQPGTKAELAQELAGRRATLDQRETAVAGILGDAVLQLSPELLIEEWNDRTPILLLPLRIETKYRQAAAGLELCVRVFPDEIAVTTHEKMLTGREEQRGIAYWKALRAAADDEARKDAWRNLSDKIGANRAAWVALQTKPTNWSTPPPASDDALQFPKIDLTKPDAWTEAPHSRVMPDRFVLLGYRNDKAVLTRVGAQISDALVVGPAPLEDSGNPSITRDAAGRLDYGPDLAWLFDFDLAVQRGMGFRIALAANETTFDKLLVLGLKSSADQNDAKTLIEELIDDHHYSTKGFSLVPQGAPTNNNDNGDSHFGKDDFLHEASYLVETGDPLFTFEPDPSRATDGQRLADALGIDYAPLQFVANAGATDHAEAVAMNRALYAGTLGYYLDSMLTEVITGNAAQTLRGFFTENVTGRGPLPAIRVGNQPYGVLLTSAFPQWTIPQFRPEFDEQVHRIVAKVAQTWQTLRPQLAHIGKSGNARQDLMNVLGLQPTSADYYHRVGYSWDYLHNLEQFAYGTHNYADALKQLIDNFPASLFLNDAGYNPSGKPYPLLFKLVFQHFHTRLDPLNLIDGLPLSEDKTISPSNYIDWLIDHAGDTNALERQDFGKGVKPPNALLYLMLQFSLLQEAKHSIWLLLQVHGIDAVELQRSREFMNIGSKPDVSHWEVFHAPAKSIIPNETSAKPLLEFVQQDRFTTGAEAAIGSNLSATTQSLKTLSQLPTARLERLLAEHVDTLNYRLDAWQMALFERRLAQLRAPAVSTEPGPPQTQRSTGLYLGSYGYLENVRPARQRRVPVPDGRLPEPLREGKENVFVSPNNGGYVHAPSLNHAAAAAILRNGYLTHASPQEREKLSVNLSSERVRRAKALIDGIRNGQSLEALLGYAFERGMHEWTVRATNPVILDSLKPALRKAFPIRRTKLPRQGFSNEPAEVVDDFTVVNGLAVANAAATFPNGVAGLPALSADQVSALRTEKTNIANSLDALRDVLTAETAYQLALGNFDRAAAVMQAVGGGQLPVEIDVVNSSRGSDLGFTNRVTLQLDPAIAADPAATLRAATEPALNAWIGTLLGDLTATQCTVSSNTGANGTVTLAGLNLQPIDLMYLIRKTADASGPAEIERRVRHAFAAANNVPDSAIVTISFADAGDPAKRSFAEVLPLLDAVRNVVGKARPLNAQDFAVPSKSVTAPPDNPGQVDVAELQTRLGAVNAAFATLFASLGNEANAPAPQANALRTHLLAIADAGFPLSFPQSSTGNGDAERDVLLAQAQSLLKRYDDIKKQNADPATLAPPLLTEMAKRFFGGDFVLIPRYSLLNAAEVAQADADRAQLLAYSATKNIALPVDEWLHGAALVRPSLHTFAALMMLSEALAGGAPDCQPMQLPFRPNDSWLGVEFLDGTQIVHDTIAFVQCLPQGFPAAASPQAGLLIDEWMEMLPLREEVTGISFNFDQPNSAPPSALLLAVSPAVTGKWTWEKLTATVLDTMERAKLRAVEPDMIETTTGFANLIPSTIAEFSTGASTVGLDYSLSLAFIDAAVALLPSTVKGSTP